MLHGASKNPSIFFFQCRKWLKSYFFDGQTTTLEAQVHHEDGKKLKSGIKNSDNTPHITLDTWGLGVDLVGGNG